MDTFYAQINELQPTLLFYGRRFTTTKEELEDLTQETIYKALKNKHSFKPSTNLKSWLLTIMRNTFINDYRKEKLSFNYNSYVKHNHASGASQRFVSQTHAVSDVERLIKNLKPQFKEILNLRIEGYKYDEIAKMKKIPVGTVKSRIFHIRRKLIPHLQNT